MLQIAKSRKPKFKNIICNLWLILPNQGAHNRKPKATTSLHYNALRSSSFPKYRPPSSKDQPSTFNTLWCYPKSANFTHKKHRQRPVMASAGALLHNPHLKSNTTNTLCSRCLNSTNRPRTVLFVNQKQPKVLGFSNKKCSKKFSRIVCSAVEDLAEKRRAKTGGSLNGVAPAGEGRFVGFILCVLYI